MTDLRFVRRGLAVAVLIAASAPTVAQRPMPTPEQRLDRLERQVQQVQRQLFPKGRPADTAGFADDPAASQSSVIQMNQRLDALEQQLADVQRMMEESGNRLRTLQSDLGSARSSQDARIQAIEQRLSEAAATPTPAIDNTPTAPVAAKVKPKPVAAGDGPVAGATATPADDAGEAAYTEGYKLWQSGDYDGAIKSLKSFAAAYPKHRRASFAQNLIGRSLLDKGDAQAAVPVLLANYRDNPGGERAPDSLYYMGQALMKLDRRTQACNAYAELSAVYGSTLRADLKKMLSDATAAAKCS